MEKSKQLIKLQKEWYAKLKEDGFEDFEYFDKNMEPKDLMYRECTKFALANQDKFESTEQYYIEAGQFYWSHSFRDQSSKDIWNLHSQGESYRQIAKQLGLPYQKIFKTVNRLRTLMRESSW